MRAILADSDHAIPPRKLKKLANSWGAVALEAKDKSEDVQRDEPNMRAYHIGQANSLNAAADVLRNMLKVMKKRAGGNGARP